MTSNQESPTEDQMKQINAANLALGNEYLDTLVSQMKQVCAAEGTTVAERYSDIVMAMDRISPTRRNLMLGAALVRLVDQE